MKITDQQLLQAIWSLQLKQLSYRVLDHFVGARYATRKDDESSQFHSSYMHSGLGKLITSELSDSQRRLRIKRLIAAGHVYQCPTGGSFCIQTQQATEAFRAAREFWLSKGVPVFVYQTVEPVSINKELLKALELQCEAHLIELFGEYQA